MFFSAIKNMQVFRQIVQPVAINVMNNLPRLRPGNLSVLPLAPTAIAAVSQPKSGFMGRSIGPLNCGIEGLRRRSFAYWTHHHVTAPHVTAMRKCRNFLGVSIERIAVAVPHLVVPHAHFTRCNRSLAIQTRAANIFTAPSVVRRSMSLHTLVVHQAKAVRRVLAPAAFNPANLASYVLSHSSLAVSHCIVCREQRNSNVMTWLGERIALVEGAA